MPQSSAKPRTPILRKRYRFGKRWYNGAHYRTQQPFATFLSRVIAPNRFGVEQVVKTIEKLVPHAAETTALEIGPGNTPVSVLLPFKQIYFLDQSHAILKKLPQTKIPCLPADSYMGNMPFHEIERGRSYRITGDVRRLPLRGNLGIVIMNEVLTHVEPGKRVQVVRDLAARTRAMIIIDRPQNSLKEFTRQRRELVAEYEQLIASKLLPKEDEETLQENVNEMKRAQHAHIRKMHATLVNFRPIILALQRSGWTIAINTTTENETPYTILTAKRA